MLLAPGNILQNMYLKRRLGNYKNARYFFEIGSGNGVISNILLKQGLIGESCDLNSEAIEINKVLNNEYIELNNYKIYHENYLTFKNKSKYDIVISSMVIEHLDNNDLNKFIVKVKEILSNDGVFILLVPASMLYWGIEDEISGHYKRYEFSDFNEISINHNFEIMNLVGLTYPVSNILFGLSNYLVKKYESKKLEDSIQNRTISSGYRRVYFKTIYPRVFGLILNEIVMYPFYLLQHVNKNNPKSMVIYCELKNK